jgi:RNA polymerase-binding transcription factor
MGTNGKLDRRAMREIEDFLKARQTQLRQAVRTVVTQRRATDNRTPDTASWATATLEDEIQVALMDRQSRQVAQIDAALQRLARGEYGLCHDCSEFIGVPRLKALPFAQRCSPCQGDAERRARRSVAARAIAEVA